MTETLSATAEEVVLTPAAELRKEADRITKRNTLITAGVGLIPIPVLDAAAVLGVQINMIRTISNLYKVDFQENAVKSIIGSLVGSIGAVSVVKAIPVVGTILGGLSMSVGAAACTYALGKVFTQHFEQGGTLLNFDADKSREYFAKEFEAGKLYSSHAADVEKDVTKEKEASRSIFDMFNGKKKTQEDAERKEIMQTNKELLSAVAQLRLEVAAMKKN